MTFQGAISAGYQNYANFTGRASRSAYWWWTLFQVLATAAIGIVFGHGVMMMDPNTMAMDYHGGVVSNLWSLANLLPCLALGARRLHDIGKSGWWQLIVLIPLIGWIVLIVWFCQKSDAGANQHGQPAA
jgi:uncharacterized membrane protein YhaH (DUF805 family)